MAAPVETISRVPKATRRGRGRRLRGALLLAMGCVAAASPFFAGTLALVAASIGSLSKVFAESIEAINPKPVEAMDAVGATRIQKIAFGVLPQAIVSMVSYTLLYWEHNIRGEFIVGAVGGGGLGFEITTELNLFQYRQFLVHAIIIIVPVTGADRISAWVRSRLA